MSLAPMEVLNKLHDKRKWCVLRELSSPNESGFDNNFSYQEDAILRSLSLIHTPGIHVHHSLCHIDILRDEPKYCAVQQTFVSLHEKGLFILFPLIPINETFVCKDRIFLGTIICF
jgi:hypothetical protein